MKSKILIKIKWLNIYFKVLILYFFCYNAYFGWNKKALTDLEATLDDVFKVAICFGLGFILHIILSYVKFKMHKYLSDINKNRYLCYQLMVVKEELVCDRNNVELDVLIRNVGARNKEEAIAKFLKISKKIAAKKKLNVECFLLEDLKEID